MLADQPVTSAGAGGAVSKLVGLPATPAAPLNFSATVDAPVGTRATSRVAEADCRAGGEAAPNTSAAVAAGLSSRSPTTVTQAPGAAAEGCTKRMRGPSSRAMRTPPSVPCAPEPGCVQLPVAVPALVSSAVSAQVLAAQGGRCSVPETVPCAFWPPSICPSMQSTSPSSSVVPVPSVAPWEIVFSQVPVTRPSTGSWPCQAPAQTPDRSGGWRGVTGEQSTPPQSPPPPQAVSSTTKAQVFSTFERLDIAVSIDIGRRGAAAFPLALRGWCARRRSGD